MTRGEQLFPRFGSASGQGVSNTWDGFGQMVTSSTNMGGTTRTLQYEYDAAGNRIRITHPDLNYFTTDFDGLNRATAILENGTATLVTIAYDALGRRTSLTRPGAATTSYAYDGASRLQSLGHDFSGTANDVSTTFGFNPASQIISRGTSNDLFVSNTSALGGRASTINGLNQVAAHNGTTFTHDANGNFTSDGAMTYGYDVENRLVSVAGISNATLTYDPMGRLASYAPGATNVYLYDGDERIAEYDSAGMLTRRYVYGPGTDEPLVHYEGANLATRNFFHADERGSIIARTDMSGAMNATNRYDEYGVPASTNNGAHGYTGQMWLPELNLWYFRTRVYSSELGRFMQVDPIGYDDQVNLYAYVANDPVNATDPQGTCIENTCPVSGFWGSTEQNLSVRATEGDAGVVGVPIIVGIIAEVAVAAAVEAAPVATVAATASHAPRAARVVTSLETQTARRAASSLRAPTVPRRVQMQARSSSGQQVRHPPAPRATASSTVQPGMPAEVGLARGVIHVGRGIPSPRTAGEKAVEAVRVFLRIINPFTGD